MVLNTDINPYYDDYDEDKNFHRILFVPGMAVQARELTQLQTILQNQIDKFGKHVFADGSRVLGGETSYDNNVTYLKLKPQYLGSNIVLANLLGLYITGATSGAKAKVIHIEEATLTDSPTIYVKYISGDSTTTASAFVDNEVISSDITLYTAQIEASSAIGLAATVGIDNGVFFVDGFFAKVQEQLLLLDKYDNDPTYRIGLTVAESIVDSTDDATLLDNAQGSPNYTAPGADRLLVTCSLAKKALDLPTDIANASASKFIELMRIENGQIVSEVKFSTYSELDKTLARRTYDESGDYTVDPFQLEFVNHSTDATKFIASLDPGKAYIKGYDFETISNTKLEMDRARDTQVVNNYDINTPYDNYIVVSAVSKVFDPNALEQILIKDGTTATIGTANLRYITKNGAYYNFYLFNIVFNTGKSFTDAATIANANTATATIQTVDTLKFFTSNNNNMLFSVPHSSVKTLNIGGNSDTSFTSQKTIAGATFTGGIASISLSGNTTFYGSAGALSTSIKDEHYIGIITTLTQAGATGYSVGDIINFSSTTRSIVLSGANQTATFNVVDAAFAAVVTIICTVNLDLKSQRTKTLTTKTAVYTLDGSGYVDLGYADGYELTSVVDDSTTLDITSSFTFDNGQRDNVYEHSTIIIKAGSTLPATTVTVSFKYFDHSGSGYFSVDSYTGQIAYGDIPTYKTAAGITIELRDYIDFRVRRADNASTFVSIVGGNDMTKPNENVSADYEFYLSRIDKITLREDRQFYIIKGVPGLHPIAPPDRIDSMTLYTISVPAYTFDLADLGVSYNDLKRYTMEDIGKIDKRLTTLEYKYSLNKIEVETKTVPVIGSTGTELYKTSFLADNFSEILSGDVNNDDYNAAIDTANNILKPAVETKLVNLDMNTGTMVHGYNKENIIMCEFTETNYITQPLASEEMSINTFATDAWIGFIDIFAIRQSQIDLTKAPKLYGYFKLHKKIYAFQYDDTWWLKYAYGIEDGSLQSTLIKKTVNNKIMSLDILPLVGIINLNINVYGMKPNTQVWPFFDGSNISSYVNGGAALYTDSNGALPCTVTIPGGLFTIGDKLLRFVDNQSNNTAAATTVGERIYYIRNSTPLQNCGTYSIAPADKDNLQLTNLYTNYRPVAQGFYMNSTIYPSGGYLTSLDLYFHEKDENLPVIVEIRPIVNGVPDPINIVAFSQKSLNPGQISVSSYGSTKTTVTFDRPVYLGAGEYVIMLHTNSSRYKLFTATFGGELLTETDRKATQQPNTSSMYTSNLSNNWVVDYNTNIMFNINVAQFTTELAEFYFTVPALTPQIEYNGAYFNVDNLVTGNDELKIYVKTKPANGALTDWVAIENDKIVDYLSPNEYELTEDIQMKLTMQSYDGKTSPIVDKDRVNVIPLTNTINNDDTGEINPAGGNAFARYITERVTLEEGFTSDTIKVIFDANKPYGTALDVYYKVLNGSDSTLFEDRPWVKMTCTKNGGNSANQGVYNSSEYFDENITYDGYTGFQTYAIKIVMLSSSTSTIPTVRNLKVISLV